MMFVPLCTNSMMDDVQHAQEQNPDSQKYLESPLNLNILSLGIDIIDNVVKHLTPKEKIRYLVKNKENQLTMLDVLKNPLVWKEIKVRYYDYLDLLETEILINNSGDKTNYIFPIIRLSLADIKQYGDKWDNLLNPIPNSIQELDLSVTDYDGENTQAFTKMNKFKKLYIGYSKLSPDPSAMNRLKKVLPPTVEIRY